MKKILFVALAILCSASALSNTALAASFGVSWSGSASFTDSTTLTAQLGSYSDVDMDYGGISIITANLAYDTSKINVAIAGQSGFNLTNSSVTESPIRIVLDRAEGVMSGTGFLSVYITNKGLASGESTTLSLNNIVGSDSNKDIPAANAAIAITYVAKTITQPTSEENLPTYDAVVVEQIEDSYGYQTTNDESDPENDTKTDEQNDSVVTTTPKNRTRDTSSGDVVSADQNNNPGVNVGIIIGVAVIILVVVAILVFLLSKSKRKH